MRALDVYIDRDKVGQLGEGDGLWTFRYEPSWANSATAFDLAPQLPRRQLEHVDGGTRRPVQWYFDNLLPEEGLRKAVAREAAMRDEQDAFALLEYLGAESAGSMTLLPPGQALPQAAALQPLPDAALGARIANIPRVTLTHGAPKRMSLAGAQHKLLAVCRGDELFEPVGATPSTHILKPNHPSPGAYPESAFNEHLAMQLARQAKLDVPAVALRYVPQPVFVIERFDRVVSWPKDTTLPPAVQRLHIIDACQLLGKDRTFKHSGASLDALVSIIQVSTNKASTRQALYRWLVFNVLVGNDDCHLKNLSFHVDADGIRLAPHYDLLCTGAYQSRAIADEQGFWPEVPMVFELPGAKTFGQVTRRALLEAAGVLKLPEKVAIRILDDVAQRVERGFGKLERDHQALAAVPGPHADHWPLQSRLLRIIRNITLGEMLKRVRH